MPKLSNTEAVLLSAAAVRPDHNILPAPEGVKANGAAFARTLGSLLRQGLVTRTEAASDVTNVESEGAKTNQTDHLIITSAGLAALRIEPAAAVEQGLTKDVAADAGATAIPEATRPDGKMGLVLDMVSRANGATIGELAEHAGWLPHTTRAALTRLRHRGFDIRLAAVDERKAYRLGATG